MLFVHELWDVHRIYGAEKSEFSIRISLHYMNKNNSKRKNRRWMAVCKKDYTDMTKEKLISSCEEKDSGIKERAFSGKSPPYRQAYFTYLSSCLAACLVYIRLSIPNLFTITICTLHSLFPQFTSGIPHGQAAKHKFRQNT
jgi:hypothetical protein